MLEDKGYCIKTEQTLEKKEESQTEEHEGTDFVILLLTFISLVTL